MGTVVHPTPVFDAEDLQAALPAQPPRRPRGRPRGARGRTLITDRGIERADLVFLAAVAEGIRPMDAAERYLGHRESLSIRAAARHADDLRAALRITIEQLVDAEDRAQAMQAAEQLEPAKATAPDLQEAPVEPVATAATIHPSSHTTLEEFASQWEADFYSESELLEMYVAEYGAPADESPAPQAPAAALAGRAPPADILTTGSRLDRREALAWLSERIARTPTGDEPVTHWLEPHLARELALLNVFRLGQFVHWINTRGARWYEPIQGFGRARARRLLTWLIDNEVEIGARVAEYLRGVVTVPAVDVLHAQKLQPVSASRELATSRPAIRALEYVEWPADLDGSAGEFRGPGTNAMGCYNDRDALQAWWRSVQGKTDATANLYRRSVERFVLWALLERKRALSDLNHQDFYDFMDWLQALPEAWICRRPVTRKSMDWRPFRDQVGDETVRQTCLGVQALYRYWHDSGYLRLYPVPKWTAPKREMQMDVMRSFSAHHLEAIRETMQTLPDGPERRRLRAVILLLQTSGLRRDEVERARWGTVERTRDGIEVTDRYQLRFRGKGNVERTVPIQTYLVEALREHLRDRQALIDSGALPYKHVGAEDTPLISVLDARLKDMRATPGTAPYNAARTRDAASDVGALTAARMHGLLKAFFMRCAKHMREEIPGESALFLKASAHWLRHTFAHQALAGGMEQLRVVQQLLGHASLATTGIYVKANLKERRAAVESIPPAL